MKTKLFVLLIAAALLTGCGEEKDSTQSSSRQVPVAEVSYQHIETKRVVTGDVRARVQTDLSFRVSGKITERYVDVGARVNAGQLLARIDPEEQKADREISLANLHSAEAQMIQAQRAFDRQKALYAAAVTSRSSLDNAQEALLTAQGALRSAKANLDTAQDSLSFTELRADANGIVTARNAEVGQVAQAAQAVFTLAHDGPRDAVFDIYEAFFTGTAFEDVVNVSLLSSPALKFKTNIREVSPTIDSSTGTIKVKAKLSSDASIALGAPVAGEFLIKSEDVMSLPWSAMASKNGLPAVWVLDGQSSTVSVQQIEVADYQTQQFTVRSGIAPGSLIVLSGTKFLRPGQVISYIKDKVP